VIFSRRRLAVALIAALTFGAAVTAGTVTAAPTVLLGDSAIEPQADPSERGTTEANQFVATGSGAVDTLSIYLDPANRATAIALGLYADAGGVPGALLAQGSRSGAPGGAWLSIAIPPTTLTAGQPYWIARLAQAGGDLVTRIDPSAANPDRTDSVTSATLPATFTPGGSWPHRTSMYASAGGPAAARASIAGGR
jgi:hypothetical protein